MTDKLQKIREEVEKLKSQLIRGACSSQIAMETGCKEEAYNEVLAILDSMQEEPSEIKSKCMYTNDNYTDEDRKILCDGCEEDCEYAPKVIEDMLNAKTAAESLGISQEEHDRIVDELIYGKEPELVDVDDLSKEVPVSEIDFEQELYKAFGHVKDFTLGLKIARRFYEMGRNHQEPVSEEWIKELRTKLDSLSKEDFEKVWGKYGAEEKEKPVNNDFEMALAEMIDKAQTSVVEPLEIATQWKDELIKLAKSEEPVSDDLEKVVEEIVDPTVLNAYGAKELARRLRNTIYGTSVSEDLGEYINELSKQFPEVSFAKLSRIAVRVAKWHKQQFEKNRLKHCNSITNEQAELEQKFLDQHLDKYNRMPGFLDAIEYGMRLKEKEMQSTIELAEDHAMFAGMEKMKEKMMASGTDVTVHIEAGNYPYIPQLELYDYDKDIPLAKEGDKYKVILIKED